MHTKAGDLTTPVLGPLAAVLQVAEAAALEEALPHVLDTALDVRIVLGLAPRDGSRKKPRPWLLV